MDVVKDYIINIIQIIKHYDMCCLCCFTLFVDSLIPHKNNASIYLPIPVIITHRNNSIQPCAVNFNPANTIQIRLKNLQSHASNCSPSPVYFCLLNVRSLNNKSLLCHDFITFKILDFFFIITETWLTLRLGGGVAVIFRNPFNALLLYIMLLIYLNILV